MATPATGAISFSDLNTEIMQVGSTTQRSMNSAAQRLGFGATSQVSMSDLRKAYGATVTCGVYADKFVTITGYDTNYPIGSVDDSVIVGSQNLNGAATAFTGSTTNYAYWNAVETGYEATNVSRIATADTLRTAEIGLSDTYTLIFSGYSGFPGSGTVTIGIKWNI